MSRDNVKDKLKGSVTLFEHPTMPVGDEDWEDDQAELVGEAVEFVSEQEKLSQEERDLPDLPDVGRENLKD